MHDLIDVPDEAVQRAAREHTRALCKPDTNFEDCVRAGLVAALPVLRGEIEAERRRSERRKIMDEVEQRVRQLEPESMNNRRNPLLDSGFAQCKEQVYAVLRQVARGETNG